MYNCIVRISGFLLSNYLSDNSIAHSTQKLLYLYGFPEIDVTEKGKKFDTEATHEKSINKGDNLSDCKKYSKVVRSEDDKRSLYRFF